MAPSLFRTRRAIEWLSVLAVGASLAALTGSFFRGMFGQSNIFGAVGTALPTLVFGSWWAKLLRDPRTVGMTRVRRGWLLSIPLAAANAAASAAMLLGFENGRVSLENAITGFFLGATVGAMFWVPAMLLTLAVFGVPIAWGQRMAREGLAGQERGDGVVGAVCALLGGAVAVAQARAPAHHVGAPFLALMGAAGLTAGLGVMGAAWWRDRLRRAFVADVEAGRAPGYRIDHTAAGKVLMRVVSQGEGYRVADFAEAVATLDAPAGSGVRVAGEADGAAAATEDAERAAPEREREARG
ncbi:MAG: hypothetical protein U0324_15135 [Polyangiales bacterium]